MKRTTIFADEDVLRKLREIAKRENTTLSDVVRTALGRYVARRVRRRARVSLVGVGRSGRGDVAERAEELLGKGFGH
ncbi:MAG: ribbon-helix-helix protein, CopG family [Candidatus Rokuibacteriota bacterium]